MQNINKKIEKEINEKKINILKKLNKKYFLNKIFIFWDKKKIEKIWFSWKIFTNQNYDSKNFLDNKILFNWIFCFENPILDKKILLKNLSYEWILVFFDKEWNYKIFEKEWVSLNFLKKLEEKLKKSVPGDNKSIFLEKSILNIFKEKTTPGTSQELPKKTLILKAYQNFLKSWEIKKSEILEKFLIRKKIRSLSWVLPVTLFTKPFPCPWKCIFCPDDVKMPKSYLSEETASQRALRQEFSGYDQISDRIEAWKIMGHNTEKLEIIILWWTFPFYPKDYQEEFVKEIFWAANWIEKSEVKNYSLEKLQEINETTEHKIVWISVEIRPDSWTDEILSFLRFLWVTRVEMWVQSLDDEVILKNKRWCTTQDVKNTTRKLKEYWFKVMYHMMTWLYWSTKEIDKKSFYDLFHSSFYHPDQLKIYPCLLLKWTELEKKSKKLNYKPNSDEEIFELIKYVKKDCIPFHTRIWRITRDVPAQLILWWSKKSNIRENISDLIKKSWIECKCIRCREIKDEKFEDFEIFIDKIDINWWVEYYIEARTACKIPQETNPKCLWLIRLFIPENTRNTNFKILENKWIIRELHVYWKIAGIKNEKTTFWKNKNLTQHKWLWEILIKKSEKIVLEKYKNLKWIAIISAIWTRWYYSKFWYKLEETYMVKSF